MLPLFRPQVTRFRCRRAPNQARFPIRRFFLPKQHALSPKKIADALNAEGIAPPSGRYWGASTIHGNRQRGTGILNNELYIGRQIWNRLNYRKDPSTGKRISRLNPESAWVITEVAALIAGLGRSAEMPAAKEALRALVDRIVLIPAAGSTGVEIELEGELAGILRLGGLDA
ncbi:recombinase family protein, partial [Tritonibacter mobilis]